MLMRTTLTIGDDIMMTAKRYASHVNRPLKEVVGEALRLGLGLLTESPGRAASFNLTMVDGRGPQAGVRLDDRDALFDLMDGR